MPRRPPHPCPGDGHQRCGTLTHTARCPTHTTRYTTTERARMARAVAAHIARHGNTCPGYQRPPHPSTNLTADHVTPMAHGGAGTSPLAVLCRSCNSRRRTTAAAD